MQSALRPSTLPCSCGRWSFCNPDGGGWVTATTELSSLVIWNPMHPAPCLGIPNLHPTLHPGKCGRVPVVEIPPAHSVLPPTEMASTSRHPRILAGRGGLRRSDRSAPPYMLDGASRTHPEPSKAVTPARQPGGAQARRQRVVLDRGGRTACLEAVPQRCCGSFRARAHIDLSITGANSPSLAFPGRQAEESSKRAAWAERGNQKGTRQDTHCGKRDASPDPAKF
jgi:hypothetical protein